MFRISIIVVELLMMVAPICSAMPATEKVAHFGEGYMIDDQLQLHTKLSRDERLLTVTAIAAAKEATDSKFDWKDLGATVLGAALKEVKWEFKF